MTLYVSHHNGFPSQKWRETGIWLSWMGARFCLVAEVVNTGNKDTILEGGGGVILHLVWLFIL